MNVKIAGIEFDNNFYDREADVLYLHVGDPDAAVEFDASKEGHGLAYATDGSLVGITILNASLLLAEDGEIAITLPEQRVVAPDLTGMLAAA
jgi:uncharacterized protein YuzE